MEFVKARTITGSVAKGCSRGQGCDELDGRITDCGGWGYVNSFPEENMLISATVGSEGGWVKLQWETGSWCYHDINLSDRWLGKEIEACVLTSGKPLRNSMMAPHDRASEMFSWLVTCTDFRRI
jgi:hypothetical protein